MKTTHRDYAEIDGDFRRLVRFITSDRAVPRPCTTWPLGRVMDWRYGLYDDKRAYAAFCDENAHLWFDAFGELVGVVLSESGDAGFQILTLKGFRFLYEEMLEWVLEAWRARAAGGSGFTTEVTERQALEAKVLERHGFCAESAFTTQRFDLTRELPPRASLEQGFTIVDMRSHPDYRAQALLRADAFEGRSSPTEEQIATRLRYYNHSQQSPIYHPETDLCVMAEDGRFVAGCEALIDPYRVEADIERVCTHSAFRRRGFARAVLQECLHRLRDLGLRNAYITGYSQAAMALYASLGAADAHRSFVYRVAT